MRRKIGQPSIDSLVLQRRLEYYPRLARRKPAALLALLQANASDKCIPWASQALHDMEFVADTVSSIALPRPAVVPEAWLHVMLQDTEGWSRAVQCCTYLHSVLDPVASSDRPAAAFVFACKLCANPQPAFSSGKALASHQRTMHGIRSPMRLYADSHGICPNCGTLFHTRLRLLAHLTDSRRPRCRLAILNGDYTPLSANRVQELDVLDTAARRDSHKLGQTHPIAIQSARTALGLRIGHVQH